MTTADELELHAFTATTGTLRIRVIKFEAMAHHAANKVELKTGQIYEAFWINHDARAERSKFFVGRPHFIGPFKNVGEPSATTTTHTDSDPRFGRAALDPLLDDFLRCVFGYLNNFFATVSADGGRRSSRC